MRIDEVWLLVRCEHDHAARRIGIAKRCEDAAANAEVGMAVMGPLDGVLHGECDSTKSIGCHPEQPRQMLNPCGADAGHEI